MTPDTVLTETILDDLEDLEDVALAEARLSDPRIGTARTHTLDAVERVLGRAD